MKLLAIKVSSCNILPSLPSSAPIPNVPPRFPLDPQLSQPNNSFDELARLLAESDPVLRMRQEEESNARQQQEEAEREAELERLENENYRQAITESLALVHPPSSSGPSSSSTSSSRPRLVSPTSESSTSLLVHGLPVTRVTTANRPAITSQMSDDWMRMHEDRTKLPQPIRKGQVDVELVQRFRIIWWSAVCIHVSHCTFMLILMVGWHQTGYNSHLRLPSLAEMEVV